MNLFKSLNIQSNGCLKPGQMILLRNTNQIRYHSSPSQIQGFKPTLIYYDDFETPEERARRLKQEGFLDLLRQK